MFAMQSSPGDPDLKIAFWFGIGVYFLLGTAAYALHGSTQALLSFYVLLVMRVSQFTSLRVPEPDVMRSHRGELDRCAGRRPAGCRGRRNLVST
jgi:hypothetical protein